MHRTVFSVILALSLAPTIGPAAQAQREFGKVISSEIAISRERAEIKLELEDGRKLTFATVTGNAAPVPLTGRFQRSISGTGDQILTLAVGRGSAVDRSWRELLNGAMDAQASSLAAMLTSWSAPDNAAGASEFDAAMDAALFPELGSVTPPASVAPGMNDSVIRLESKIQQLEEQLDEVRGDAVSASRRNRGPAWLAPLRHVGRGITGIFSLLITYSVIFGLGFVMIMFGGRRYIEGVADTVRAGVGRSFLVGLAGSFLLIPVFVLGIIALAISIVGIPALLIWVPLFPIAALLSALLGFISIAHAAGETWAARRYQSSEWLSRANSYYFIATGLVLLSVLFFAANVITMAGPWLGFINNILNFLGVVVTWAAITIGFGAVLVSRAGSRPVNAHVSATTFTEGAGV